MDSPSVIDPVALTIMAVNRLGAATFRSVWLGKSVTVTVPDHATCEIFRAALLEMQKAPHHRPPDPDRGRRGAVTHIGSVRQYRTIFISDMHLGTRGCKATFLLDFLRWTESEYLYLVGDMVDGWRLRKSWYWPQSHNDVVQKMLRKARKGTKVILRSRQSRRMAARLLRKPGRRRGAGARGDPRDRRRPAAARHSRRRVRRRRALCALARALGRLGLRPRHPGSTTASTWCGGAWAIPTGRFRPISNSRSRTRSSSSAITPTRSPPRRARRKVDGIVCGHIHHAEIAPIGGILYCNDGDWVESCTALVEHFDGRLEILHWMELRALDPLDDALVPEPEPAEAL